jgi:hypothetical protein
MKRARTTSKVVALPQWWHCRPEFCLSCRGLAVCTEGLCHGIQQRLVRQLFHRRRHLLPPLPSKWQGTSKRNKTRTAFILLVKRAAKILCITGVHKHFIEHKILQLWMQMICARKKGVSAFFFCYSLRYASRTFIHSFVDKFAILKMVNE